MQLLLIRHAIALDRDDFALTGRDDALRPLSDEGRRKMVRAARGLRALVPEIGLLATSPLVRATETAAIVADVYRGLSIVEIAELAPGAPAADLDEWLHGRRLRRDDPLAVIGHEPDLGELFARLLGAPRSCHRFRKGGAALLTFPARPAVGRGELLWALPPAQLRALAG